MEEKQKFSCEFYWKILQSTLAFVRFSDQKAGLILSVYGVVLPILISNGQGIVTLALESNILFFFGLTSCVTAIISIFFSFKCLNPRLSNPNSGSVIYFDHIAKHSDFKSYFQYSSKILGSEEEFSSQIAEQIYANSKVAKKKFTNVSWSIRFFFVSLFSLMLIVLLFSI